MSKFLIKDADALLQLIRSGVLPGMLRRLLILAVALVTLEACIGNRSAKRLVKEDDDFSLNDNDNGPKVDDKTYFNDLQRSESVIGFESSFPLSFAVGKSIDKFENVPEQAKNPTPSILSVQLGDCHFTLKTGATQVDRYILAGQWIKLSEGLPAGVPVKLEPNMDLNVKLVTKLNIDINASQMAICRNLMEGKRIYIGRFHLNKSKIGLLGGTGFPRSVFSSRSMEPKGKRVFVRWQAGAPGPILIDDLDFPATSESGIYRALLGDRGYYYLIFLPALRMDQLDQVVIKIPFQAARPTKKKNIFDAGFSPQRLVR